MNPVKPQEPLDEYADVLTIKVLPKSDREMAAAFDASDREACEQLPKGEPLEIRTMTANLTMKDRLNTKLKVMPSSRASMFSVGLEFEQADRASLPLVSGGVIAAYLNENCVLIQARIRKDLLDRKLYYHHRPLALTAAYRGSRTSLAFEGVVAENIRSFHGIGLFVKDEAKVKAEHLRTLVLIFRNKVLQAGTTRAKESYEFAFVRGRDSKLPDRLDHHVFVTGDNRQTLYYVSPYIQPNRQSRCSIIGRIAITRFDAAGIYPKESVTRSYKIDSQMKFKLTELDKFCTDMQLTGGIHTNVTAVLDAIIDRKLRPSGFGATIEPDR